MKEYKRMWIIDNYGRTEEIAVSTITKRGYVKYYPVIDDKVSKKFGIKEMYKWSTTLQLVNTIELANSISSEIKISKIRKTLQEKENSLSKIPDDYKRLKEEYLKLFKQITEHKETIEKEIKELKEQIEELKRS